VCTIPTETGLNHARGFDFLPYVSELAALGPEVSVDMCRLVRACASICKIYTCGSNVVPAAKVQIDYRLRYAHTHTRAAHCKLPVDPCATRRL
jgi:hypothetical protein